MPEKKTSNMLVRDIPIDVWERIDKLCRRKSMKRRDFVEQALRFFEGEQALHFSEGKEPLRFYEGKEAEYDGKQSESGQPPDIEGLKRDIENLKREIKKDEVIQKVEQKIDIQDQKQRVSIDQIKPDSGSKIIMKRRDLSDRTSPSEEKTRAC